MKHAHYDVTTGEILGYYEDTIHSAIPTPNIELTDEAWLDCINNPGLRRVDTIDGVIINYISPPMPLTDYRDTVYIQVRRDLYAFITDEQQSDFPEWKQANYASRLAELADAFAHNGSLTTDESTERTAILSVIAWKNGLLAERDRVKAAIDAAADNAAVDTAAAGMQLSAPPFKL